MTTPKLSLPRRCLVLSALAAGTFPALPVLAQPAAYPNHPVRVIVPFGAGTSTDNITRVVADAMGRALGQSLIIENKAGGGGTIGTDAVARAQADGYTLVMGTVGTHAINKSLYRKLSYDPMRDFAAIALVGQTPTLLVVGENSPLRTLKDLAAAAGKAQGIGFASAGNGTSGHLAGELLKSRLGGTMVHVPYKEGGLALSDVMSGQVDFMFYHPAAVLPQIKAGKLRALGASGAQRSAAAPDVPTIAEQIGGNFDLVAWFMLYAPAATPAPVLARLREVASAVLAQADVQHKLAAQGVEKANVATADLPAFGQREIGKWAELVKQSGAQVD
jgi:tripartite-type tricarboxylate transporter receptor subunit TctC